MKIKFNKFERVAGVFVIVAVLGAFAAFMGVAVKRGWFENKVEFETTFATADGLHIGTVVQMSGLRVGSVEQVELLTDNQIRVVFLVSKRFHDKIRKDSVVRMMRPFIIGEKVLDISVGTDKEPVVAASAKLPSEESMDLMDLMNGRKLGPYLLMLSKMMENLKLVAEAFLDPERTQTIIKIFDDLRPLMKGMSEMSKQVVGLIRETNKNQRLATALDNLVVLSTEFTKIMPLLTENSPEMIGHLSQIAKNTAALTDEMQKFLPMMSQMAPELPHVSKRAVEALDETVITLKALQKSFILRGNVREVREEEQQRLPAAGKTDPEGNSSNVSPPASPASAPATK